MLRSMTGFGSVQGRVEGVEYAVEIRSVNNRYFKSVLKLPESWAACESEIDDILRTRLTRGTITLTLRMRIPDERAAWRVNAAVLSSYLDQIRPAEVDANPVLRIDLASLLSLPGACQPPELDTLLEESKDGVLALVASAADALVAMRQREGQTLKADLLAQCKVIEEKLALVASRAPLVVKEYHERLGRRVAELTETGRIELDSDTLAREVAIFAERCDVSEEIARLNGHVTHFRQTMAQGEPGGRKMDFLAQEMLREANTIGSKANDAEIARAVVDMKTAVDRIKEQVQNVE